MAGLNQNLNLACFYDLTANFNAKVFRLDSKGSKPRMFNESLYEEYDSPKMIWQADFFTPSQGPVSQLGLGCPAKLGQLALVHILFA